MDLPAGMTGEELEARLLAAGESVAGRRKRVAEDEESSLLHTLLTVQRMDDMGILPTPATPENREDAHRVCVHTLPATHCASGCTFSCRTHSPLTHKSAPPHYHPLCTHPVPPAPAPGSLRATSVTPVPTSVDCPPPPPHTHALPLQPPCGEGCI